MTDALLAERQRLGALQHETLHAPSLVAAHGALGALLGGPARAALERRLGEAAPGRRDEALRRARAGLAFLRGRAAPRGAAVPRALAEYLACLDAWSGAGGLGDLAAALPALDGRRVSRLELALLAQDDNGGCQTGMRRRKDGSVLLWHTEEDTIGLFDLPRVVSMVTPDGVLSAFLYPYLLPGPAFGWGAGQVQAIDSLHVRRGARGGALTSVASWLTWRLGASAPARRICAALFPFVDACAINQVHVAGRRVAGLVHELGGRHLHSRALGAAAGASCFQGNTVADSKCALAREEALSARQRGLYERRRARAQAALLHGDDMTPQDLLDMMTGRVGGAYAYANSDVKGHCVAWLRAERGRLVGELYVGAGAARPGDAYRPQWRWA